MAHVVRVIDGGVVDHRGNHQVDVHPERVVKHEPDKGKEAEDIAHRQPAGAGEKLHLVDSSTVDNVLITSNYSIFKDTLFQLIVSGMSFIILHTGIV